MKKLPLIQALILSAVCALPAFGADLSKVDRRIAKEPAYKDKPKYCLLVFGPEAKNKVWLVLDGDLLYVDRNGNGDLTDDGEPVKAPAFEASRHPAHEGQRHIRAGDLTVGGLTHTELTVGQTRYRRKFDASKGLGSSTRTSWERLVDKAWRQAPDGVVYYVAIGLDMACYGRFEEAKGKRVSHAAIVDGKGKLVFGDRPETAPIVHFGGPLTVCCVSPEFVRGNDRSLTVVLGSAGMGPGTFARLSYDLIPGDAQPSLEVQFPAKDTAQGRVVRKYTLKERC